MLRKSRRRLGLALWALASLTSPLLAQRKRLEVGDLTADPPIWGRSVSELAWLPDGRSFSYLVRKGTGENETSELWIEEAESGRKRIAIPASALSLPDAGSGSAEPRKTETVSLDGYVWSPDGASVLLSGKNTLWLYRRDGRGLTQVTRGEDDAEFPAFSPDGKRLAYARAHDLFVVDLDTGQQTRLTTDGSDKVYNGRLDWVYEEELASRSGRAFEWSPDGMSIAFLRLDDAPIDPSPITDFLAVPPKVAWQRFPYAGDKNPRPSLHVVSSDGKTRRDIALDGEGYFEPSFSWSANSQSVCYRALNRAQNRRETRLWTFSTGESRKLFLEEDPYWVNEAGPVQFLKNGRYLLLSETSGYAHLSVGDLSGKSPDPITRGNWMVDQVIGVDEKKSVVYFTATEEDPQRRPIYRVGLDGSGWTKLTVNGGNHSAKLSPDGRYLLDTYSTRTQPPSVSLLDASGRTRRVVDLPENRLAGFDLGRTEEHQVTADDGTRLLAQLTKPSDFDPAKKYPVIVYVYGGPHAQEVQDIWNAVSPLARLLAGRGYLVWTLDNRGSWGRGHGWESAIFLETGKHELADQLAGVRYLKGLSYVDATRIGIWGWSYGGYMTLYALTRAPEVWKCGVAGAPVTHWRYYDTIYTERYMRTPQENPKGYEASAPITKAADLKAKLLVIQGLADDNVHPQNTIAFLDALTKAGAGAGHAYQLQIQSGQKHGFRGKASLDFRNAAILRFFEENL